MAYDLHPREIGRDEHQLGLEEDRLEPEGRAADDCESPVLRELADPWRQSNVRGLSLDHDCDLASQALFQIQQSRLGKARPGLIQRMVGLGNLHDIAPSQAYVFRAIAGGQDRGEVNDLLLPALRIASGAANTEVRQVGIRQAGIIEESAQEGHGIISSFVWRGCQQTVLHGQEFQKGELAPVMGALGQWGVGKPGRPALDPDSVELRQVIHRAVLAQQFGHCLRRRLRLLGTG